MKPLIQKKSIATLLALFCLFMGNSSVQAQTENLKNQRTAPSDSTKTTLPNVIMDEVVVRTEWIYQRDGNTIVDISQIANAENVYTDRILKQLPGVMKTSNEGYTLNGKPAVVFINGVKQNIPAKSLAAFLSSLPANAVTSVELIDINTGKYAANIEAVIDIKMKSDAPLGSSFQPYAFVSHHPDGVQDVGGNLFYMVKKNRILFHNTLAYSNERIYAESNDSLILGSQRIFSNTLLKKGRTNVITYHGLLTYQLNKDRTLRLGTFIYTDYGRPKTSWQSNSNAGWESGKTHDDLYNLSATYTIPASQKAFNGSMSYAISYGGRSADTDYFSQSTTPYRNSHIRMRGWMHALSADFTSNFDQWLFTYGTRIERNSLTDKTEHLALLNPMQLDFAGAEWLTSLYAQMRYRLTSKMNIRVGARLENTHYEYELDGATIRKQYTNVFPSLLFYYNTKSYNLVAGFQSFINRPHYEKMLPGRRFINESIVSEGRPDIKPTRTYRWLLYNTLFQYAKFNLSYSIVKDYQGALYKQENNMLLQSYYNILDWKVFAVNVTLPFAALQRKLMGQVVIGAYHNSVMRTLNGFTLPTERPTHYWKYSFGTSINYAPSDRFSVLLDGSFTPRTSQTLIETAWDTGWSLEASYAFLQKKNLILSVRTYNVFDDNDVTTNYFLNNRYHLTSFSSSPVFEISLKLRLNRGQSVTDEYREYRPNASRMQ